MSDLGTTPAKASRIAGAEEEAESGRLRRLGGVSQAIGQAAFVLPVLAAALWAVEAQRLVGVLIFNEQFLAAMLGLGLVATFVNVKASRSEPGDRVPWYDWLLTAAAVIVAGYVVVNFRTLVHELSTLSALRIGLGAAAILLIFEATRRLIGWTLVVVAVFFLCYARLGDLMPGVFAVPLVELGADRGLFLPRHQRDPRHAAERRGEHDRDLHPVRRDPEGGEGRHLHHRPRDAGHGPLSRRAGKGVGRRLDLVRHRLGQRGLQRRDRRADLDPDDGAGGLPAPPCRRDRGGGLDRRADHAAGDGHHRVPDGRLPVDPLLDVVLAALLPAILYYVAVFVQVDLEAARARPQGCPARAAAEAGARRSARLHLLAVPLAVLIWTIMYAYWSPGRAGLAAAAAALVVGLLTPGARPSLAALRLALVSTGQTVANILVLTAVAGVVIGAIQLSGLGYSMSTILLALAGDQRDPDPDHDRPRLRHPRHGAADGGHLHDAGRAGGPGAGAARRRPARGAHVHLLHGHAVDDHAAGLLCDLHRGGSSPTRNFWPTALSGMRYGVAAYLLPFVFPWARGLLMQGSGCRSSGRPSGPPWSASPPSPRGSWAFSFAPLGPCRGPVLVLGLAAMVSPFVSRTAEVANIVGLAGLALMVCHLLGRRAPSRAGHKISEKGRREDHMTIDIRTIAAALALAALPLGAGAQTIAMATDQPGTTFNTVGRGDRQCGEPELGHQHHRPHLCRPRRMGAGGRSAARSRPA